MKKILGIITLGLLLVGCGASLNTDPSKYANTPASELCIGYYSALMRNNIHAKPRRIMIEQRGIDCSRYKEEGIMAGQAAIEYRDRLKKNLEHLGSGSTNTNTNREIIEAMPTVAKILTKSVLLVKLLVHQVIKPDIEINDRSTKLPGGSISLSIRLSPQFLRV